jgi:hypothetical protein
MMMNLMCIGFCRLSCYFYAKLIEVSKHWLLARRFIQLSGSKDIVIDIVSLVLSIHEWKLGAKSVAGIRT